MPYAIYLPTVQDLLIVGAGIVLLIVGAGIVLLIVALVMYRRSK